MDKIDEAFLYARRVLDELVKNGATNYPHFQIYQDASCILILSKSDAEKVLKIAQALIESDRVENVNGEVHLTSCIGLRNAGA